MTRLWTLLACLFVALCITAPLSAYPKPSVGRTTWQLDFTHGLPQRLVINLPGQSAPKVYWYMTYTVTNRTDREQIFLPVIEMLTDDGRAIRSDKAIPLPVFQAIKAREKKPLLEQTLKISGRIGIGEDQARDGVAIWCEPMNPNPEKMGSFSIFVSGLSGESVLMKKQDDHFVKVEKGQDIGNTDSKDLLTLRKTLQLNYLVRGDEIYPGEDEVNKTAEVWIMR